MGSETGIAWTDSTWNPVRGCSRISPGCENCYAETMAARFSAEGQWAHGFAVRSPARWTRKVELVPDMLDLPLHWKKPRRIFVDSMSDLFHESLSNEAIAAVFGVMAACPQHTFQILTKRAERLAEWFAWADAHPHGDGGPDGGPLAALGKAISESPAPFPERVFGGEGDEGDALARALDRPWPLPNVWLGVSVEDQQRADERIPHLLRTPAAVRFLSCEPLLGPVDIAPWLHCQTCGYTPRDQEIHGDHYLCRENTDGKMGGIRSVKWVIVGGESGPGARPMRLEWARSIVEQCKAADVACFFKQAGTRPQVSFYGGDRDHFEANGHDVTPDGWDERDGQPQPDALVTVRLAHKGGDLAELPEDLRVREFPTSARQAIPEKQNGAKP